MGRLELCLLSFLTTAVWSLSLPGHFNHWVYRLRFILNGELSGVQGRYGEFAEKNKSLYTVCNKKRFHHFTGRSLDNIYLARGAGSEMHRVEILTSNDLIFFNPKPPHVLVDFVVLPPVHGSSVTDFWGWDSHEAQLRCSDDVSSDIGGWSVRRALKPKFY